MKNSLISSLEDVFRESYAKRMSEKIEGSWAFQGRNEQRRRMGFVLRLAEELKKIRDGGTRFSSLWAEWAIEAIITGNLEDLKMWGIDGLSEAGFNENAGPEAAARYAPVYANFREICEEAYLTAQPMEKV